jgi:hypothetical protein
VPQAKFATDIHSQKGLTCAACHGGDATSSDMEKSMSRTAGFRGKISRAQVPALCAGCHANASYIRGFNPSLRTDQLSQYQTSVHGKKLASGDSKVAVCIDCHSVHDIRPASDSRARTHVTNVAQTCSRCHADGEHMKPYKIATDQFAGYQASVHHEALTVRGDLSAPTCTTCHGNHGATPPGLASVEFVCSTCHVFQAQLFDKSVHKKAFAERGMAACITCHDNHRITKAEDTMIGISGQATCLNCHSQGEKGYAAAAKMREELERLKKAIAGADEALERAEQSGMEVSQARLEQAQARDALTKARVSIHAFQPALVEADVQPGIKVAEKGLAAGIQALKERDYRRMGLLVSLGLIFATVIGLRLFITEIERKNGEGGGGS